MHAASAPVRCRVLGGAFAALPCSWCCPPSRLRKPSLKTPRETIREPRCHPGKPHPGQSSRPPNQTKPHKRIQFGVGGVSANSFKFGEYNGLENSCRSDSAISISAAAQPTTATDTWRWRSHGHRVLASKTRNLSAEFGKQGKFQFRFAYNEILANTSDTFPTPFLGAGTDNLTLPSNWIEPVLPQKNATALNLRALDPVAGAGSVYNSSGVLTPPTAAQLATLAGIRRNRPARFPICESRHSSASGARRNSSYPDRENRYSR